MRPLASSLERMACLGVDAQPFGRYFQPEAGAFRSEFIVNRPAKLIGNEIADHGRAKTRGIGRSQRWAISLPPLLATGSCSQHYPGSQLGSCTDRCSIHSPAIVSPPEEG